MYLMWLGLMSCISCTSCTSCTTPMEIDSEDHVVKIEKIIRKRKKTIPKALREAVWKTYVGEEVGRTHCMVCQTNYISQLNFHCGHVQAEAAGGATDLQNLRPICASCNYSMGTTNLHLYRAKYFGYKSNKTLKIDS